MRIRDYFDRFLQGSRPIVIYVLLIVTTLLIIVHRPTGLLFALAAALVLIWKNRSSEKKSVKIIRNIRKFESERRKEIQKALELDPGFKTLCVSCVDFDHERWLCLRQFHNLRVAGIDIGMRNFCLYWRDIAAESGNRKQKRV